MPCPNTGEFVGIRMGIKSGPTGRPSKLRGRVVGYTIPDGKRVITTSDDYRWDSGELTKTRSARYKRQGSPKGSRISVIVVATGKISRAKPDDPRFLTGEISTSGVSEHFANVARGRSRKSNYPPI